MEADWKVDGYGKLDSDEVDYNLFKLPLHIRIRNLQNFKDSFIDKGHLKSRRSANRMRSYWKRLKSLRKFTVASVADVDNDTRPFVHIRVDGVLYFALLDSGPNRSVIGGKLATMICEGKSFQKYYGYVKTADGQRQRISGIMTLEFIFRDENCKFEFLVIPSIQQDIICGIDFWKNFGISISMNYNVSEITASNTDRILLSRENEKKLVSIIELFPNSERGGLESTSLV